MKGCDCICHALPKKQSSSSCKLCDCVTCMFCGKVYRRAKQEELTEHFNNCKEFIKWFDNGRKN